jgi:phosphohistidine phosphatase
MKTILLMRHAKAEAGVPGQKDFARRLATRGGDDAFRMGRTLAKLHALPQVIVASPALRARETAEAAAKAMKFEGKLHLDRALYDAPGDAWLASLRSLPETCGSVLVVAHSPGIAEAAAFLCGGSPGGFDIPTAGLLAFDTPTGRWRDLRAPTASLRWFLRPKLVELL